MAWIFIDLYYKLMHEIQKGQLFLYLLYEMFENKKFCNYNNKDFKDDSIRGQ